MAMSIPFRGSAYDYLSKGKPFYKDKTISMMGLITEIFRRRAGDEKEYQPHPPGARRGQG